MNPRGPTYPTLAIIIHDDDEDDDGDVADDEDNDWMSRQQQTSYGARKEKDSRNKVHPLSLLHIFVQKNCNSLDFFPIHGHGAAPMTLLLLCVVDVIQDVKTTKNLQISPQN